MISAINNNCTHNRRIAFGKKVPTETVIDFVTACDLNRRRGYKSWAKSYHTVVDAMLGKKFIESDEILKLCSNVLTEKYKILSDVILNYGKSKKSLNTISKIKEWKKTQVKLIGSDTINIPSLKPKRQKPFVNLFTNDKEGDDMFKKMMSFLFDSED